MGIKYIKNANLVLIILLLSYQAAFPQFKSPFVLKGEVIAPVFIASFSMMGGAYQFSQKNKIPTAAELIKYSPAQVNVFDRYATRQYSKPAKYASDAFMFGSGALSLIHLANPNARKDFGKIAVMQLEVFMLNTAMTNLIKEAVHRPRPLVFNPDVPMNTKRSTLDNFKSFYSGHTSTVASQTFFFAYTFAQYNPHSKFKPLVWTTCALAPAITGLLRVKAGKHYWSDVLVGYVTGALIGVGVPWLHSKTLWKGK